MDPIECQTAGCRGIVKGAEADTVPGATIQCPKCGAEYVWIPDDADKDSVEFLKFGDDVPLSRAAFQLNGHAILHSLENDTPGIVTDDYLNSIAAETTRSAVELCTAGYWHRWHNGYVVLDRDLLAIALKARDSPDGLD